MGWTTDEIGLKWLDRLFHERTKDKSRRRWRLLFVDGHGSHVTLPFLEQSYKHKILVAVYPPHATHRLQKKLMEEFRAQEGASAILFSTGKVQKAVELKERREQAILEGDREKQLRIQEKAAQKALEEQEARRKRSDRAMAAQAREEAKAQKQADRLKAKEAKEAQTKLKEQSKASASRSTGRSKKQPKALVSASKNTERETGEVPKQISSRSGRTITKATRFRQ
jgi:hypothetical protein